MLLEVIMAFFSDLTDKTDRWTDKTIYSGYFKPKRKEIAAIVCYVNLNTPRHCLDEENAVLIYHVTLKLRFILSIITSD